MTKSLSARKRLIIEVLTTALAVVGAWYLPLSPTWVPIVIAVALLPLFAIVWWRLRHK